MAKPRLYLFHGNNSQASSTDVARWTDAFLSKYGNATQYILQVDELSWDELTHRISQALSAETLFPEPKYVLVKRTTSTLTAARIKDLIKIVGAQIPHLDDQVTVVFWEDKLLPAGHALLTWFIEHELAKRAQVKVYKTAQGRGVVTEVLKGLDVTLSPEARRWLDSYALTLEKQQRIAAKLRTTEELSTDTRAWTLHKLIDSAALLAEDEVVEVGHLEKVAGVVVESVSPFEIINAAERKQWHQARELAARWETVDEGAYFGLVALLRNSFKRQGNHYALEMLAEIEILSKNVSTRQAWLLDLFFCRLELADGTSQPIIEPKRLWLSHLQRVD